MAEYLIYGVRIPEGESADLVADFVGIAGPGRTSLIKKIIGAKRPQTTAAPTLVTYPVEIDGDTSLLLDPDSNGLIRAKLKGFIPQIPVIPVEGIEL